MEKTHYRKAFNSPYLSSADIVEPTVLTVSHVQLSIDQTKKTKDMFNTAHFVEKEIRRGEKLKPMILNAVNSRTLANMTGSKFIEDWINVPITVYVNENVKFGRDTVEGLRISTEKPRQTKRELTPANKKAWDNAKAAFSRDGNLNAVKERFAISQDNEMALVQECSA
jgi:hypothetical protein